VDHYRVLGVRRSSSTAEIRRAYLEMRRINEAWAVLGDQARRRRYDDDLRAQVRRPVPKPRHAQGFASPDFVPFDPTDDPDDPAFLDDTPIPGTGVPRWLQLLGPSLLVASVGCFCVGLVTSFPPFLSAAVLSFIGALLSFLAAPLVAVRQSARAERRAAARRDPRRR
jgi:curved DNA-binding protein CbpA